MSETTPTTTPTPEPTPILTVDKATPTERIAVIGIVGALAILAFWKGQADMAQAYAMMLVGYFLTRAGA